MGAYSEPVPADIVMIGSHLGIDYFVSAGMGDFYRGRNGDKRLTKSLPKQLHANARELIDMITSHGYDK